MIWPFRGKLEFFEGLQWNTDVLQSGGGAEQRIALREAPLRTFGLRHVLNHQELAAARELLREEESLLVPDWPLARPAMAAAAGSSVAVSCPLAEDLGVSAGDEVLLWSASDDYQSAAVEAVGTGAVTVAGLAADFAGGYLVPLAEGFAAEGLSVDRPAGRYAMATVDFTILDNDYLGSSAYPQYRSLDVMTDVPVAGGDALAEGFSWALESFDNQMGRPAYLRTRDVPENRFSLSWRRKAPAEIRALRAWIYSRFGKQKAFWASSWGNDFVLRSNVGAAHEFLTVTMPAGLPDWSRVPFDVEVKTRAGALYHRRITSVAVVGEQLTLAFSGSLGVNLAVADVMRVSLLRCARFDADRVEMLFRPGEGVSVTVPCLEVLES